MLIKCRLEKDGYRKCEPTPEELQKGIFTKSCICTMQDEFLRELSATGLREFFLKKRFETFDVTDVNPAIAAEKKKVKDLVEKYAFLFNPKFNWLFLNGNIGSGKTHLIVCTMRAAINKGIRTKYVRFNNWVSEFEERRFKKGFNQWIMEFKKVGYLVIDDLFKSESRNMGGITAGVFSNILDIIDHRYCADLPTGITSEFTLDQILEKDPALGSRIAQKCKMDENTIFNFEMTIDNQRLIGITEGDPKLDF